MGSRVGGGAKTFIHEVFLLTFYVLLEIILKVFYKSLSANQGNIKIIFLLFLTI